MGEFNLRSTRGDPKRAFWGDRLRGVAAGEHIGVLKGVCLGVAIRFLFFEPESMVINNFDIIHLYTFNTFHYENVQTNKWQIYI